MLNKEMLKSDEWKKLSSSAKIIYIYIKANYNGKNKDNLALTYSGLKKEFAAGTVSKALKQLINNTWIEKTKHGGLYRYYCTYKLTGKYDPLRIVV